MRTVKFKGFCNKINDWVYGSLVTTNMPILPNRFAAPFIVNEYGIYEVDKDTIGQYIGEKDPEDTEIYEGDMLLIEGKEYEVIYSIEDVSFRLKNADDLWAFSFLTKESDFKVICNIRDRKRINGLKWRNQ